MSNLTILLPHIPRLFPAWFINTVVICALWAGLLVLYFINVSVARLNVNEVTQAKKMAMTEVMNPDPHLYLAQLLWENSHVDTALRELFIADSLRLNRHATPDILEEADSGILGASVSPLELISAWEGRTDEIIARYQYWAGVASQYPSYRDAYVLAGVAAYQAGKLEDARVMLGKATLLDPNNEAVSALSRQIL